MLRNEVASVLAQWAALEARALFVGNGFVGRDVYSAADSANILYLQGGMGLVASVAAGWCVASGRSGAALEGDGSFVMGLAVLPLLNSLGCDLVHVVFWNGVMDSTGGQPLTGVSAATACAAVRGLGMKGEIVRTGDELRSVLTRHETGPITVFAVGPPNPNAPGRVPHGTSHLAERFNQFWRQDSTEATRSEPPRTPTSTA